MLIVSFCDSADFLSFSEFLSTQLLTKSTIISRRLIINSSATREKLNATKVGHSLWINYVRDSHFSEHTLAQCCIIYVSPANNELLMRRIVFLFCCRRCEQRRWFSAWEFYLRQYKMVSLSLHDFLNKNTIIREKVEDLIFIYVLFIYTEERLNWCI